MNRHFKKHFKYSLGEILIAAGVAGVAIKLLLPVVGGVVIAYLKRLPWNP